MSTFREEALKMHKENQGKLSVSSKVKVRDAKDLSLAYSPGVAEPCLAIHENEGKVYDYTMKGNLVAVVFKWNRCPRAWKYRAKSSNAGYGRKGIVI